MRYYLYLLILLDRGCKWLADNVLNMVELCQCIERIEEKFRFETFILLDRVLTDDPIEPEYSANTAYACLEDIVTFHRLYFGENIADISDFLKKNEYEMSDIELFDKKCRDEDVRYADRDRKTD